MNAVNDAAQASPPWAASLFEKYFEMRRLRRGDLDGSIADPRPAMAALAARYPGALREIDEMPLDEIERRLGYLASACSRAPQGPPEPWAPVSDRYHRLLRGALGAKRWLNGRRQVDDALRARFASEAPSLPHGSDVLGWAGHLAALASPPGGRLVGLVLVRLSDETTLPHDQLDKLLFGFGRRCRSTPVASVSGSSS